MADYVLDKYGGWVAAEAPASERVAFIRRTYTHLVVAILAFVVLEAALLNMPGIDQVMRGLFSNRLSWLLVLGLFMVGSWVAEHWARSDHSRGMQYAGLGLYVVLEALIFLPIMWIASTFTRFEGVIPQAGLITIGMTAALTLAVFITRKDFSFLGPILCIAGFVAMGLIVAGILFGFNLGLFFSFAMVALASAAILYHTSNVLHHYRTDQYVAASLALFASVALLFWYVLQIVMSRRN